MNVVTRIGEAARERNILGYAKLTFLSFIGENYEQFLWATGMNLAYSDLVGMTKLLEFSTQAKMDAKTGIFEVSIENEERVTRETSLLGAQGTVTKRETMKKKGE